MNRIQNPESTGQSSDARPRLGTIRAHLTFMNFLRLYLVGYFVLLFGGVLALWQAGILAEIPGVWIAIGAIIAIGFGIMLAVVSSPRTVTTSTPRDLS